MHTIEVEQGSEEWLELRRNKITATDIPVIMGESKYKNAKQLYLEKMGAVAPPQINPAMQRGKDLEPHIRELVQRELSYIELYPRVVVSETNPWLMASLDGINDMHKILIELKTANRKDHETCLKGKVPKQYVGQCQAQLYVTGFFQMNYYSYFVDSTGIDYLHMIIVQKNEEYIKKMLEKAEEFYNCMINFKSPK